MNSAEDVAGLVARLRDFADAEDNGGCCDLQMRASPCRDAAKFIESQTARLTEVKGERDEAKRLHRHDRQMWDATRRRAEAAELALSTSHAERDRAVAAAYEDAGRVRRFAERAVGTCDGEDDFSVG